MEDRKRFNRSYPEIAIIRDWDKYSEDIVSLKRHLLKSCRKLWAAKSFSEIVSITNDAVTLPKIPIGQGDKEISEIYLLNSLALSGLLLPEKALELAHMAAYFNRQDKNVQWQIRELNGLNFDHSVYYQVECKGLFKAWDDKLDYLQIPFVTIYGIVADDESRILGLIRDFERKEVRDSIEITYTKIIKSLEGLPLGIYESTPLLALPDENIAN